MFERSAHPAFVETDDTAKKPGHGSFFSGHQTLHLVFPRRDRIAIPGGRGRISPSAELVRSEAMGSWRRARFPAYEVPAQIGRPDKSQSERREERYRHGDGKRAEESTRHARDGDEREEDNDRRNGRTDKRRSDLAQGTVNCLQPALTGIAMQS